MKQTFEGEYDSYMFDDDYVQTIIEHLKENEGIEYDYEPTFFGVRYRASIYSEDELIARGTCEIEDNDERTEDELYSACLDNIYQGLEDYDWQVV